MAYFKYFAAITLLFLMAACGGGGGGGEPTNNAPVATAQSVVTTQNIEVEITLRGTDTNGDSLSYAIASDPVNGTLTGSAPNLTYTPNDDFSGDDSFSFTVNDGALTSAAAVVSISVNDITPDDFSFTDKIGAQLTEVVTSDPVTITGINTAIPVSITGGEYAINDGVFTNEDGVINNDDNISIRLTASDEPLTMVEAVISIGDIEDTFSVTTYDPIDSVPNAFSFSDLVDVAAGGVIVSNAITVSGINTPSTISISGGEYSVNDGAFISSNGNVNNGDTVAVRVIASTTGLEVREAILSIGGVVDTFSVTTVNDITPNTFSFSSQEGVVSGSTVTSNSVSISGMNNQATVSVTGGEYSVNSGEFTSQSGIVGNGANIRVRQVASAVGLTEAVTTLNVGTGSAVFSVTSANDISPEGFSFTAQPEAAFGEIATSNPITVSGMNNSAAVTINGGEYSINGGAFTTTNGSTQNGGIIVVRLTASAVAEEVKTATLSVGTASAVFTVTTASDTTPSAFSFIDQTDVTAGERIHSNAVIVSGINSPTSISIVGGEYSINGGAFISAAGTTNANDSIIVRVTSANVGLAVEETTLSVGGISDTFSVTTVNDITPDSFTFVDQADVAAGELISSAAVILSGLNNSSAVSIVGGEYAINGAAFTASAGTAINGDSIVVRVTSSTVGLEEAETTLTVGSVSDTFSVSTVNDVTPDAFSFVDQTDVVTGEAISSNAIVIEGVNNAAEITIVGGEYSINGGAFTAAVGNANVNDSIVVQVTSSTVGLEVREATLSVGGTSDTFSVTTLNDLTPEAFTFTDQVDVTSGTVAVSNAVVITGINNATGVSVVGGEYSLNGAAYTAANGSVNVDDTIELRVTASAVGLEVVNVTLTVGGVSDTFSVTSANDLTPEAFTFIDQTNVPPGQLISAAPIIVAGINNSVDISIAGGEYAINSDPFTSVAGSVNSDDSVVVRVTSSVDALGTVAATLTMGGVSDTFNVATSNDFTPPTAHILFPSERTLTEKTSMILSGITADDGLVASVTVGGVDATSTDDFKTWQASVPLVNGFNELTVSATDAAGNTSNNVSTVTVESRPFYSNFNKIKYDSISDRLLFLGLSYHLYGFDIASEVFGSVSSSRGVVGDINPMIVPKSFDIDENTNTAYVADAVNSRKDRILSVNLATGERNIVTADADDYPAHALVEPRHVEIDSTNNYIYVSDSSGTLGGRKAILRFDLTTGVSKVITDNSFPGAELSMPQNMTLDKANNRLLIADRGYQRIIATDLTTGGKSIFSADGVPDTVNPLSSMRALVMDIANDRAITYNLGTKQMLSISLATGSRTVLADDVTIPGVSSNRMDMVLDSSGNRVFIVGYNRNAVYSVDLATGLVSVFSDNTRPDDLNPLSYPTFLTLDSSNNRLLVTNLGNKAVLGVSLTTGSRTVVSSETLPDAVNEFSRPEGIAVGLDNKAYIVDSIDDRLLELDLLTGARTVVADNNKLDTNKTFNILAEITVDETNNKSFVLDAGARALFSVDNATGERTLISNGATPNEDNPFQNPVQLIQEGGRGLVLDDVAQSIFSVDLSTGARTVFSGSTLPDTTNPFTSPKMMVHDNANSRLLVIDTDKVIAVSLIDGSRTVFSSNTIPDDKNMFWWLHDITLDASRNRVLVKDNQVIMEVDLTTGARTPYLGGTPNNQFPLIRLKDIAYDPTSKKMVLVDNRGIVDINQATGSKTEINLNLSPSDMVLDIANNRILTIRSSEVVEIDLDTGVMTTISSSTIPDNINPISWASHLAYDSDNNRAFVISNSGKRILTVDLATGARTILSSSTVPDDVNVFTRARTLVFDKENNRLLLEDNRNILAIDIATGARTVLVSGIINTSIRSFVLDKANDRIVFITSGLLYTYDLTEGVSTSVSDRLSPRYLTGLALSSEPNQVFLIDRDLGLLLVDLTTGERAILSK